MKRKLLSYSNWCSMCGIVQAGKCIGNGCLCKECEDLRIEAWKKGGAKAAKVLWDTRTALHKPTIIKRTLFIQKADKELGRFRKGLDYAEQYHKMMLESLSEYGIPIERFQ
jgi:hypothetical protein